MDAQIPLPEGGRVLGVGADLVDVERIRGICERHGDRFIERVFTAEERRYCLDMRNPYPHLAARFAAKEAISKAFGTGIGEDLGWQSMGVVHSELMQPLAVLTEGAQTLLQERGGKDVLLTLSHTATTAMAVAILVA